MANNTDEQELDNPTNIQSENPSDEIIPTKNTDTIDPNKETENMEVHKHPHHVTHKKKWGEYLLEFLMLFLAVFLGFVAENIRENSVERHREKEYMQQMSEDLKADTAIYADYARRNAVIYDLTDTIVSLIKNADIKNHITKLTYSARILTTKWKEVAPVKRTYEEMKSSGYLRLISNKKNC